MARGRRVGGTGWAGVYGSFVGLARGTASQGKPKGAKAKRHGAPLVSGEKRYFTLKAASSAGLTLAQWQARTTKDVNKVEAEIRVVRSQLDALQKDLQKAERARQAAFAPQPVKRAHAD